MSAAGQTKAWEVQAEWVHLSLAETSSFKEVYGFVGTQGTVNLEGIRFRPAGRDSDTLLVFMHPASTLQLLPMPRELARQGAHVLCCGSRYQRNDSALIMENVAVDLGAYIRHAREAWKYRHVVLMGWSGGGSLALFYQSQAERPTLEKTAAGDPCNIKAAGLLPADAVVFQAAHTGRAQMLAEWIDPSVLDENDPDRKDPSLDLYGPECKPPYTAEFITRYRAAQWARLRRRTAWVKETLERFRRQGGREVERGFVTHRTMADPRFLDPAIDPNDRPIGTCFMGVPETVNNGPVGIARFSTLRSWLSQWSPDDTQANGEVSAQSLTVPFLALEHSADDAVPQPHVRRVFDNVPAKDKTMAVLQGATHYFVGQPDHLRQAAGITLDWLGARGFAD